MRSTKHDGRFAGRVLIVEADRALAGLYADVIATHAPGLRIDACPPERHEALHDNLGGADVVVCSCDAGAGNGFDVLRAIHTERACATVLALIPADRPDLADRVLEAGAADVLLRAPGYLDQLAVAVRKNIAASRRAMRAEARRDQARRELEQAKREMAILRLEAQDLSRRVHAMKGRPMGALPLPVITRPVEMAKAA
jgi:DNA-binding NarL/FixJ family response regulator